MSSGHESQASPRLILEDMPCAACGFNLRGLTSDRACPDCGAPVSRSMATEAQPPASPSAPPTSPRPPLQPALSPRAKRGFTLILWGIGGEILLALSGQAVGVGFSMVLGQIVWLMMAVIALAAMGARIVQARGWWIVTLRRAFVTEAPPPGLGIGFCRTMVLLHLGASILNSVTLMGMYTLAITGDGWPRNFSGLTSVPMFFEALLSAAAMAAKMLFLLRLGAWMGDTTIVRAARLWLWLGPLFMIVGRAWNTIAGFTGLGITGSRFDVLFAPMLWIVATGACWWVVIEARRSVSPNSAHGNP